MLSNRYTTNRPKLFLALPKAPRPETAGTSIVPGLLTPDQVRRAVAERIG